MTIDQPRVIPKPIEVYKRFIHRLPTQHPFIPHLEDRIYNLEAGYAGENFVDNFLKQIAFSKHYAILKDLHLPISDSGYLQLDTIILTPKYLAILEIKNIRGKISFQRNPDQLIREVDGEITAFKCPEQQIIRHAQKLTLLLNSLNLQLPVKSFIVFASTKTIVAQPPKRVRAVMGCDIATHINSLNVLPDVLPVNKFKHLLNYFTVNATGFIPKPLSHIYPLNLKEIKRGLLCAKCFQFVEGSCSSFGTLKKTMQQQALEDWFYLYKETISNKECMEFLNLKDKHAASYLLRNSRLYPINNTKSRYYVIQKK
ncbi:nuclease-related domain-containing protein [Psychrobacillus sp. FSL K6-4046]|uniref:nuclease-related domain-containing protein n=1 Tax=Psychrobacillus sp. FSL K6-4046 TaxID=2921550 RepID=UPI00315AAADB